METEFGQNPDKIQESQFTPEQIVDLDATRFNERLDVEYEKQWNELLELGKDLNTTIEQLMTPVWLDDSLPRVFRDRAMLTIVGDREVRKALGEESRSTNMSLFLSDISVKSFENVVNEFNATKFCMWTHEAWKYQKESGIRIIDDVQYLRWEFEFFERGLINEYDLEKFIDNIDIIASSPIYKSNAWMDDSNDYSLDPNRFPLISDVLNKYTVNKSDEKIQAWAVDKLSLWLEYQTDKTVDIPEWLKTVSESTGFMLYKEQINRGQKNPILSWDHVRRAADYFGLELFTDFSSRLSLATVHNIADSALKERLLKSILKNQNEKAVSKNKYYPFAGGSYEIRSQDKTTSLKFMDIISEVVESTYDAELKELYELELKNATEYTEQEYTRREEVTKARRLAYESSIEYQERQKALAAFTGKIAMIAELK